MGKTVNSKFVDLTYTRMFQLFSSFALCDFSNIKLTVKYLGLNFKDLVVEDHTEVILYIH